MYERICFQLKDKSQNFVLLFTCLEKPKFKTLTRIERLIHKQNQTASASKEPDL